MKKYLLLLLLCGCIEIKYPLVVTSTRQSTREKNFVFIGSESAFPTYFKTDSVYHVGDTLR